MDHFGGDEYGHQADKSTFDLGFGWLHYSLIRSFKPRNLLCVGSRYGYIPGIMAQACKDNHFGHVHFVDAGFGNKDKNHWTGVGYWKTKQGKSAFDKFRLHNQISTFVTTTKKFASKYPQLHYDYIYIDGDHSYRGVKSDYKSLYPKLNKSGLILFHDISVKEQLPEGNYGVHKLWKELANQHSLEINYLGSGLGCIQKK
ncbi:class I SAM-dependent methyltransferase [Pseudomonadota bacterium]